MLLAISQRRRARQRRRDDARALRAEFELERLRGLAALRALVRDIGELERTRMISHRHTADQAAGRRTVPAGVSSGRR